MYQALHVYQGSLPPLYVEEGCYSVKTVRSLNLTRQLRAGHKSRYDGSSRDSHTDDILLAVFSDGSLQTWTSYLEQSSLVLPGTINSLYACFAFEILHNFHLGVSKNLKIIFENVVSWMTTSRTLLGGFGTHACLYDL